MSTLGEDRFNSTRSRARNTAEAPSGAPMMKRRVEIAGSNGSAVEKTLRTRASTSAIGADSSVARAVGTTLGCLQEQRIIQLATQPAKAMTHGRSVRFSRRRLDPRGALRDGLKQHQEIEIGSRKINFVQHVAEIVSLDSTRVRGHSIDH
jgi:hypothetical protein